MPLAPFPDITHIQLSCDADPGRWKRALVLLAAISGLFVYDLFVVSKPLESSSPTCSDSNDDLLLQLFSGLNKKWTENPESVPYIATGVLSAQYSLGFTLIARFVMSNEGTWIGILTTWVASVFLRQFVNTPLSDRAIDYGSQLPYPLERGHLISDNVFSIHFYLAIVYLKYLKSPMMKVIVNGALWLNCIIVACFLLAMYHTTFYALITAWLAGYLLDDIPPRVQGGASWLMDRLVRLKNRCFPPRAIPDRSHSNGVSVLPLTIKTALTEPKAQTTVEEDELELQRAVNKLTNNTNPRLAEFREDDEMESEHKYDDEEEEDDEDNEENGHNSHLPTKSEEQLLPDL